MTQEQPIKIVSDNEVHFLDPQTGGIWRIISPHQISVEGALMMVEQVFREQKIQPGLGTTLTVEYKIAVQGEGQQCHSAFDDILQRIHELRRHNRSPI